MVTYDAKIVAQFVEQQYAKARQILIVQPVIGVLLGAAAGWLLVGFRPQLGQASVYGLGAGADRGEHTSLTRPECPASLPGLATSTPG